MERKKKKEEDFEWIILCIFEESLASTYVFWWMNLADKGLMGIEMKEIRKCEIDMLCK